MRTFVRGLIVLGVLFVTVDAAAQCTRDTDCKGNRVCNAGQCVEVAPAPAPAPAPAAAYPPGPPPAVVVAEAPPIPVLVDRLPRNVISTNPAGILSGSIGVQYERVFSRWFSLSFGVSFYDSDMDPIGETEAPVVGATVTLQPRFYLLRRGAPSGLYLSPVISVGFFHAAESDFTYAVSGAGYSVGGLVGWSWIFGRHFNVKLGLGAQYLDFAFADEGGTTVGVSGVAALGELTLGWAF